MNVNFPSSNKRRSRRLRKKLHLAEFKEEGFTVNFRFKSGLTDEEELDVLMKFITEAIEARNLLFGGGEGGFVTRAGRESTSEDDRNAVRSWLNACASVQDVSVGDNEDAWYSSAAGDVYAG